MNRKLIISFFVFVLFVGALVWLIDGPSAIRTSKPKNWQSDWEKTYDPTDKNPRNISFFLDILNAHVNDSVYLLNDWLYRDTIPNYEDATYLFIGNEFGMSDADYWSLTNLVDSGATLFISFNHLTSNIYSRHFEPNAFNWDYNRVLFAYIGDTTLPFYHVYQNDTIYTDWYTFEESYIRDTNYRSYLFAMKHPFAFYEKHNRGKIHFHSIPNLFENIHVIEPNGFAHTKVVLSKIPKDKPVIFLSCANYNSSNATNEAEEDANGGEKEDSSLIQFILKNEALRLAFILLICLLLIYVLFRAKRKESVIPGYTLKNNQSLPYVETLGSIYLSRNVPRGVLQVMRKNFYATILKQYYIDLSKQEQYAESVKRLQERISYDSEKLNALLNNVKASKKDIDNRFLHDLHKQIKAFYTEMGIQTQRKQFVVSDKTISLDKSMIYSAALLFIGLIVLTRGLYLLSSGAGLGMLFVIPAVIILFLGARFMRIPVMTIHSDEVIVYGMLFGKKHISLNQTIHCTVEPTIVTFECEDGSQFTIRRSVLSNQGKATLTQFVEFIKLQNS